jgi:hypothetical protein
MGAGGGGRDQADHISALRQKGAQRFLETGRSIHLGKGIWLLRMRPNPGISARKALAILSKIK